MADQNASQSSRPTYTSAMAPRRPKYLLTRLGLPPLDPSEKKEVQTFRLLYTRVRNYWGYPELAYRDVNNDPWEINLDWCESDPDFSEDFIHISFPKPIVGFFEPITRTLVRREDALQIKDMTDLPNGQDTVWSLVYKKPEEPMDWWENLNWTTIILLKDEFSPILYLEDLERGVYKDTLLDVFRWHLWEKIFPPPKQEQKVLTAGEDVNEIEGVKKDEEAAKTEQPAKVEETTKPDGSGKNTKPDDGEEIANPEGGEDKEPEEGESPAKHEELRSKIEEAINIDPTAEIRPLGHDKDTAKNEQAVETSSSS